MSGYQFIGKATPTMQKQINTSLVYHYIYSHNLCHRAVIAKDLNLSAPAVSRAVEFLLERGDIFESGKVQLENGKRVVQLQFNADKGYVIGIDLLRSPLKLVIANFSGNIVTRHTGFDMNRDDDITEDLIKEIEILIDKFEKGGFKRERLTSIGVGIPATVDSKSHIVIGAQRYDYLLGKNYVESLEKAFSMPTYVDNVANMAVLAERIRGVSKGKKDIVFFEISTGVGLGLILNGMLYPGSFGAAGEVGYAPQCAEHLNPSSDSLGHLERTISIEGLAMQALKSGIGNSSDSLLEIVATLFTLAHQNRDTALKLIHQFLQHLIILCSNFILVLNPEQVVLGGSITEMPHIKELVLDPLTQKLDEILPFEVPQFILSSLGDDSGVIGAVETALNSMRSELYPYRFEH